MLIEPTIFEDCRGYFLESYSRERYKDIGINDDFIQENITRSHENVLRGLHYNRNKPQAQILTVIEGAIFDVVVDIRRGSPTFGKWFGVELSQGNFRQIYMAPGFAHGFCVLSKNATIHYKVSQTYDARDDGGIAWNDRELAINWPVGCKLVSEKDKQNPILSEAIFNGL